MEEPASAPPPEPAHTPSAAQPEPAQTPEPAPSVPSEAVAQTTPGVVAQTTPSEAVAALPELPAVLPKVVEIPGVVPEEEEAGERGRMSSESDSGREISVETPSTMPNGVEFTEGVEDGTGLQVLNNKPYTLNLTPQS